ncbi:MAG: LON peptidase substrate-binding domain-containing protein [Actinomycetota bacterium]
MDEIGLFPLGTALVPSERLPLHIFEPRYRELIGECLDRGGDFGLVFHHEGTQRAIGTRASVLEVLERFPDGRLNVVVVGQRRFRIMEPTQGRSFLTALVQDIEEPDDPPSPAELAACMEAFGRILTMLGGEAPHLVGEVGSASFAMAAHLDLPADLKQELLEMASERERVLHLTDVLLGPIAQDLQGREIARRAATNGKVEHS